ncbi:hypothetical protein GEMRC1_005704 [Eukaryota sp. GEM-RC1]
MAQTVQSFLDHKTVAGCRIAFVVSGSGTGKTAALADALENNYGFYLNFGAGTPGITPSCEAFKLLIERGQFMSLRVQNVGLITTIQIIFYSFCLHMWRSSMSKETWTPSRGFISLPALKDNSQLLRNSLL